MLEIKGKVNTAVCYAKVIEEEKWTFGQRTSADFWIYDTSGNLQMAAWKGTAFD